MDRSRTDLVSIQRNVILILLLALAGAAWVLLVWQGRGASMDVTMASPTMGLRAPLFLLIWVVMMVAMMFPTAAPMILTFHRVQSHKRRHGDAFVSTWVFVTAYMVVWTLAGVAAYLGARAAEALGDHADLSRATAARIGGAVLVAAGLYQLTPLKDVCLSKCRTPITFIMTAWHDGEAGALRMGLLHGAYCLGCCWLLFVILFPLGIMNMAAMAAITLLIFAEKTLPWGRLASRASAAALVVYGAVVMATPWMLPTFTGRGGVAMPAPAMSNDMHMPMSGKAAPPATQ